MKKSASIILLAILVLGLTLSFVKIQPVKATSTEQIINGDFETGSLYGWVDNGAGINTTGPHSGAYCAAIYNGGIFLEQIFSPAIPVNTVLALSFWIKTTSSAWLSFTAAYNDSTDTNIVFTGSPATWIQKNEVSNLTAGKYIFLLAFANYWSGTDYLDDVSLTTGVPPNCTLNVVPSLGGIVNPSNSSYTVPQGTTLSPITAIANTGYNFAGWSFNSGGIIGPVVNPISWAVTENGTLHANFVASVQLIIRVHTDDWGGGYIDGEPMQPVLHIDLFNGSYWFRDIYMSNTASFGVNLQLGWLNYSGYLDAYHIGGILYVPPNGYIQNYLQAYNSRIRFWLSSNIFWGSMIPWPNCTIDYAYYSIGSLSGSGFATVSVNAFFANSTGGWFKYGISPYLNRIDSSNVYNLLPTASSSPSGMSPSFGFNSTSTITFYKDGYRFLVNGSSVANGTTRTYTGGTVLELEGAGYVAYYWFSNFTYSAGSSHSNPSTYITEGNDTIWLYSSWNPSIWPIQLPENPPLLIYFMNGNYLGFIQAFFVSTIGDTFYMFILVIFSILVYIQNRTIGIVAVMWLLMGGFWAAMAPSVAPVPVIITIIGIAGVIYSVFARGSEN